MKKLFVTIVSLVFFALYGIAQDCYSDNRSKGVSAYNSGKYAEAKNFFQAAKNCDMKPLQNDVATWITKCDEKLKTAVVQGKTGVPNNVLCDEKLKTAVVQGALNGVFSVSPTKKVVFSKGNLQYKASTNTWRFAEHQYDIVGDGNSKISSSYSGWIELFGWGTSGWNSGANAYQPYSISVYYEDYFPGGSFTDNLTGSYANADWGVYNKISNGGNTARMWRTLTYLEWRYVLSKRTNASSLKGSATVNGVSGIILLPDNWTTPDGITFKSGMNGFGSNSYTTSQWGKMESNGAVFLPAAGYRYGSDVDRVGSYGDYWSSSASSSRAYYLGFDSGNAGMGSYDRDYGHSVRLVKNVN